MNEYKLFAQRIGLIGITNLILSLSNIILLPILTKNLSIGEYGTWNQLMTTVGLIPLAVLFGLPFSMIRFFPSLQKKEEIQELFYSIFFVVVSVSTVVSVLIYIFSNVIAISLFDKNILVVKIMCIIIFIESLNNLFFNYLRATEKIKSYSILLLIQTLLSMSLVSFFVIIGKGILGAILGFLLKGIIVIIILFTIIVSEIGFKVPKFINLRKYLSFGLPTVPINFSNWVVNSSDRYVIGIFLGTAFVGFYSPGYALGGIINIFFSPLFFILPVILSRHYDNGNYKEVRMILSYAMKYSMSVAIPSAVGLSLLSKPLLMILTTPEIAREGYLITPFTALSTLLLGAYGIVSHICVLEKKTKILGKVWTLSAVLNLTLNFIFIPYLGILGAAITTLIAFTFSFIVTCRYCSKLFVFDMKINFIMKSVLSSFLMGLIIIEIKPIELYDILLSIGVCAISYGVVLTLLKGFEKRELDFFRSIVQM